MPLPASQDAPPQDPREQDPREAPRAPDPEAPLDPRVVRRRARIARWDRPLRGWRDRLVARAHMLLVDHGLVRVAYLNLHPVDASGRLLRAAQPTPGQIARLARRGLRTVVNLRGGREHGSWPLEREACERAGVALVEVVARSREAPSRETIEELAALFARVEYPALIHCKSGADRAGLVAALYLLVVEGRPLAEARRQLGPRYGHLRFSRTGVLDAFLDAYGREGEARGLSLLEWARTSYDPAAVQAGFRAGTWSSLLGDRLIRRE